MKAYPDLQMFDNKEEDRLEKIKMYGTMEYRLGRSLADEEIVLKPEEREHQRSAGRKRVCFPARPLWRMGS